MRESFDRVKRKYRLRAIIYAIAGGVCAALAAAGIFLLAFKLGGVKAGWYVYLAAGVALGAAVAAVIYFAARPADKKLAKKLDALYGLDERAGTMIEFEGQESEMLAMQRADADAAIKALPKRKPSVMGIGAKSLAAVVAAALLVTGIVVPGNYKTESNVVVAEEPFEISETILTKLKALISDVEGDTTVKAEVQENYLDTLNGLYDSIQAEDATQDSVNSDAINAMYAISQTMIDADTYDNIAYVLTKNSTTTADTNVFADALRSSASVYTEYNSPNTYSDLATVYSNFFNKILSYIEAAVTEFKTAISAITDETVPEEYAGIFNGALTFEGDGKGEGLEEYYTVLSGQIANFGTTKRNSKTSGDDLYDALYDLYRETNYYVGLYAAGTAEIEGVILFVTEAADSFIQSATNAMVTQAYTYMLDVYVRQTVAAIFGLDIEGYPIEDGSDLLTDPDEEDPSGGGSGGGTGEFITGSEYIYNPETGDYVLYTDLTGDLYAMLTDDSVSDEMKEFITQYLNYLQTLGG